MKNNNNPGDPRLLSHQHPAVSVRTSRTPKNEQNLFQLYVCNAKHRIPLTSMGNHFICSTLQKQIIIITRKSEKRKTDI